MTTIKAPSPCHSPVFVHQSLIRAGLIVAICSLVLQGCALFRAAPADQQVRELSEEWLAALMSGDYKRAYTYTSKGYQSTHSARDFGLRYGGIGMWEKAEVDKVSCEPESAPIRCITVLQVTYRSPRGRMRNTRPLMLTWINPDRSGWALYYD